MKRITTAFLQAGIVLLGIAVFIFMLFEPHLEGRNANATLFEIYFNDPFLAYAYASSILFYVGLFQAFTLLGNIKKDELFSRSSLKLLETMRYCATAVAVLLGGAVVYLTVVLRGKDDIAGGVALCLILILILAAVAVSTFLFEKHLEKRSNH